MEFIKKQADLFDQDLGIPLVHCIAADARMGAGIATQFVKRYPEMRSYLQQIEPEVGQVISYVKKGLPMVYNLITKEVSFDKPTREDFNKTIETLKRQVIAQGVSTIAIPLIGAGLDRLDWYESEMFIRETFKDTDITIILCLDDNAQRIHDESFKAHSL